MKTSSEAFIYIIGLAPDTPELRTVLLHLVGEGALRPTEGLGNGAVGDVVVVHPHGDDGVRIGVKLPETGEEAFKQVAVCNDALNGRSLRRNHVHQGILAIFTDGNVQRSQVARTTVLTNEAVAVTGPDLALRADAAPMILLLHPDAGYLPVVFVADFLADRNLLTGGAVIDERVLFVVCQNFSPLIGLFASHRGRKATLGHHEFSRTDCISRSFVLYWFIPVCMIIHRNISATLRVPVVGSCDCSQEHPIVS